MSIKVIAFDVDDTLIDFMTYKRKTAKAAAKAMIGKGLDGTVEQVTKQIFEIYDEYGLEYQKTFSTLLWDKHGVREFNKFEHIQQAGVVAYLDEKFKALKPYPDVAPTLKKLSKKYELYIVTDAPRNKAWQRLVLTGLDKHFPEDHVVTYDDTKVHKPDPMPFRKFLEMAKVKSEEVLFVGDSIERDIKGAKKAGLNTALAMYGGESKKMNGVADFELERFGKLINIIKI